MAPNPVDWETIQTLPPISTPIIAKGWISLRLLPITEGTERRIQPRCTLCGKSFATIVARDYSRSSNWLVHIRTKHPKEAAELKNTETNDSTTSIS